jgi:hypothetical protein
MKGLAYANSSRKQVARRKNRGSPQIAREPVSRRTSGGFTRVL